MRVAVVGIGAMGCLFGAKLSLVTDVTLVGNWRAQLTALRHRGVELLQPDGRSQSIPLSATNNPQTAAPADLVLILVKSYQTQQAAKTARRLLSPNGVALTLQNGLGNLEQLTAVLINHRTNLGITSEGAALMKPGVVRHAGSGHTFIAESENAAESAQNIVALFEEAGFQSSLAANAEGLVWGKLAINAGINPLTALLQVNNGYLAESAAARNLMTRAAREVAAVANAQSIQLPFADAAAQALAIARTTAANHSSMRQDLANGRRTEIAAICGAVVDHGRRFGVATPVNEVLLTAVQQAEQGIWPDTATPAATLQRLNDKISQMLA